ncbi:hypothetical protein CRM90_09100 [Mycobacterium sp. ENV421]|uniref:VG15 protein n=1 Tax=Mycobacterium sp. ENV421 TaxID=1213407 RepID=UPI000C9C9FD2|nr:hypothetical protein [Mycobacterium sp. ENV421]PND58133.1 hypothetical protein CRM90_09100 [Mycobacterium sp. ENV421]
MTAATTGTGRYQELTADLAGWTAAAALHVYVSSGLSRAETIAAIAAVVAAGNAAAATLAALFVATSVERATRAATPPTGIAPPVDDTERLARAVATVLDDTAADPSASMRLERLARSEVLDTGQQTVAEIITQLPVVTGWRRVLDADPCERCVRWAEDGRIFPKDAHFKRHYGCNCQTEIVTMERKAP